VIRWYDWAFAFITADLMLAFVISSLTAENMLWNMLYGFCAGLMYSIWSQDYCRFRLIQEKNKGKGK
jgi:hypothetical protein